MPYPASSALNLPPVWDSQERFDGGADKFTRNTRLQPNQFQDGQNVLIRDNGVVQTRYGVRSLGSESAGANPVQGLFYYDKPGAEYLLRCINGDFTKWDGSNWTAAAGFTADTSARLAATQLLEVLYVTDGVNQWRSWDGTTFTALGNTSGTITSDPPVGATIVEAHAGRVFATGISSAPDTIYASRLLTAGGPVAGAWDHVNFSWRVGFGEGQEIRALAGLRNSWMFVGKSNSIWLVNTDPTYTVTATSWEQVRLTDGIGVVSKRCVATVGDDVMFLSQDGIRSVRRMQGTSGEYEVAAPLSRPIQPYIDRINWQYAYRSCAWRYEHLVFFAVPLDSDQWPEHVFVWNDRTQSWMGGYWTGWAPTQFAETHFSDVDRLVFGDTTSRVMEWLDYTDEGTASTFEDASTDIESLIEFRATDFGEPFSPKSLDCWELRFIETGNTVEVTVYCDDADEQMSSATIAQESVSLPVNLPFNLPSIKPVTLSRNITVRSSCREAYLKVRAASGKIAIRSVSLGAFVHAVDNYER